VSSSAADAPQRGRIEALSLVGVGSTFEITLPAA
jgi:signal transduction histidine kinase